MPAQYKQRFKRFVYGLAAVAGLLLTGEAVQATMTLQPSTTSSTPAPVITAFTIDGHKPTSYYLNNPSGTAIYTTIARGASVTLRWSFSNATCNLNYADTTIGTAATSTRIALNLPTPGTRSTGPINTDRTYVLQCVGAPQSAGGYTLPGMIVSKSVHIKFPSACTYTYGPWSACVNGVQTRTVVSTSPSGCTGTPVLKQACTVPQTACTAPTVKPTTTCNLDGTANITWDWTPGVSGATGYQIDVSKSSSFSPLVVATDKVTETVYAMTSQTVGTYYARVRTVGGTAAPACSGTSAWSTVASVTPNCTPPPPPPPLLTVSLKANYGDSTSCGRNNNFILSWTATPGAVCTASTSNWSASRGNPQTITFTGTAPTIYGISCTLSGQTVTDTVTVSPR